MDLNNVQRSFLELFDRLTGDEKEEIFQWMHKKLSRPMSKCPVACDQKISEIVDHLREILPFSGVTKSEIIHFPRKGQHADCDPRHTLSVDAFLYDEDMLDFLCDNGQLQRNYCRDCGSHNTAPLTFVSHSMSRKTLKHLFLKLLPDLTGKIVLDIGSRLGAVLYGAHVYSKAKEIIGVEINEELCRIQEEICKKHNLTDKIKVIHGDVCHHPELLKQADVIIIHSVVDFFLPEEQHAEFWRFVHSNFRGSGKLLITTPSLEIAIGYLDTGIDIDAWVKLRDSTEESEVADDPDLVEIFVYQCL